MFHDLSLALQVLTNPSTGDHSGTWMKILIVAGVLCVVAVAALLIVPKLNKKDESEEPEIEEINEE